MSAISKTYSGGHNILPFGVDDKKIHCQRVDLYRFM